jgi:transcriptional regulator GlxA family with amidase domain
MAYDPRLINSAVHDLLRAKLTCTLNDVSRVLCIDRHVVERGVRVASDSTFREIRNRIRLERAVALLTQTPPLSIKEVASAVGYGTPQAFARFVSRMTGKSPSIIRLEASRPHVTTPATPERIRN